MLVLKRSAAPASHHTNFRGYGSRIALAVLACPGRRGWIQISNNLLVIARSASDEAIQHKGRLDCFAYARNDEQDKIPHSRGAIRPGSAKTLSLEKQRAQGMPGASHAPAASRAKMKKHDELVTTGSLETIQHSLREWFYGLFRALPGDRAWLSPSSCETCFAQLDASVEASGPHGFAVRVQQPSSRAPTASIASPTQRS